MSPLQRRMPLKRKPFKPRVAKNKDCSEELADKKEKRAVSERKTPNRGRVTAKGGLVERFDRVFSLYIRLRDAMDGGRTRCISCGKVFPFEKMQAGHYISRANMSTRYDIANVNSQCWHCNCYLNGNLEEYKKNLIKKIGQDNFDELMELSRLPRHWSDAEMKDALEMFTKEVKRLSREKGISVSL